MKVIVLSSGSKGNTTYIETKQAKILIDAGNSTKYIVNKLNEINVDIKDIDALLITHTHSDHIKGIKTLIKKSNLTVYISELMYKELDYVNNYQIIDKENFAIKDCQIEIIKTSHDTTDSNGYIINNDNKSIVYITDTGYINKRYYETLSNKDIYIFESNHDVELLSNCSYPFEIRQRILGDKGHLSNIDSAKYLEKFIGDKTKYVILAHLSEENNTPDIAYNCLTKRIKNIENKNFKILIAEQNKETELITI